MSYVSGVRIREARLTAGMSRTQLAHAIVTSERNIVRWETDRNTPRAEHLAAIAKATGRDMEFFYSEGQEAVAPPGDPFSGSDGAASPSDRGKRRRGTRTQGLAA